MTLEKLAGGTLVALSRPEHQLFVFLFHCHPSD